MTVFELTVENAPTYLDAIGVLDRKRITGVDSLGGGVSNTVVRVRTDERCVVLKQPRANLAVEDDWRGWQRLTERVGTQVQVLGDDLIVTDADRLDRAVETGATTAVLVKPNQAGTLSRTFDVVERAHAEGLASVVSARSSVWGFDGERGFHGIRRSGGDGTFRKLTIYSLYYK